MGSRKEWTPGHGPRGGLETAHAVLTPDRSPFFELRFFSEIIEDVLLQVLCLDLPMPKRLPETVRNLRVSSSTMV